MKLKKVISIFLVMILICMNTIGTSLAAEFTHNDDSEVEVSILGGGVYEITVNGNSYFYNELTGVLTNEGGEVVAQISSFESDPQISSRSSDNKTGIKHGMSVGSRWTYSYSQWSTIQVYLAVQEVIISAISSFLISRGLSAYFNPQETADLTNAATQYLVWLNENNLNISENAFYVRTYVYCNRYILSNFAEIYQGYCTDYTPLNVLAYDQEITY